MRLFPVLCRNGPALTPFSSHDAGRDFGGMRRGASPALSGQRSYSGHLPHGLPSSAQVGAEPRSWLGQTRHSLITSSTTTLDADLIITSVCYMIMSCFGSQDQALLRAASCSGPAPETPGSHTASPLRSHSAMYPQQQHARQQPGTGREGHHRERRCPLE